MPTLVQEEIQQADIVLDSFDSGPVERYLQDPTDDGPTTRNRAWIHQTLVVLCYLIAAVCLYLVFRKMNLGTIQEQMHRLRPGWLLLAMLASAAVYLANAVRWTILTRPLLAETGKTVNFWRTLHAVYIGLFFNEVLPLRPGEVIRCYLFSRWNRLSLSATFASAVMERILDGVWLLTGFFVVAVMVHLPKLLMKGAAILMGCIVVGMILWLVLAAISASHRKRSDYVRKSGVKADLSEALEITGRPKQLLASAFASAMPITMNVISMWFLMKGAGMDLPVVAAMAVLLIIRVATVIPNTPGNLGSYQFFCAMALGLFHIGAGEAAVFSVLSFTIFTIPLLIGGAIAVALSGQKMGELLAIGKATESAQKG